MKIHNIFPLTIIHDKIEISDDERNKLVHNIFSSHKNSKEYFLFTSPLGLP